jgi:hypothetical protein
MVDYLTQPLAVDLFSRTMVDLFDEKEIISVPTGFQTFFGRPEAGGRTLVSPDAEDVDIDIMRGNEKTAALIPRGIGGRYLSGKNPTSQKFTNINRVFPLAEEESNIDSAQLTKRMAGENPYSGRTRLERMRMHARSLVMDHIRRIVRLQERLCAQSIRTGKQDAILGTSDTTLQYDFRRNAAQTAAAGTVWTDAGADPVGDLDVLWNLCRTNGHVNADMAIFAGNVMDAFMNHAKTQALADNRRFETVDLRGQLGIPAKFQKFIDAGFTLRGRVITYEGHEIWLFTYSEYYDTDAGTATLYMPAATVIMGFSGARCDRYFGPPDAIPQTPQQEQLYQQYFGFSPTAVPMPPNIKNLSGIAPPGVYYHSAYHIPGSKAITLRTQSAPIYATTQTDAFATLTSVV